jgi:putative NADH-flavin reductase
VPEGRVTSVKVAIIGASGFIGSYVRDEALARGYHVTAIVRHPEKITVQNPRLTVVKADILKGKAEELVKGHDAVISAYSAGRSGTDIYNEQIKGYKAIIGAVKRSGVKRLLVVGGASTLEVSPGVELIDTMRPEQITQGMLATREMLYMLRKEEELEWTFLSPPATISPGERTGLYRAGKDRLVKDKKGESKISTQDYANAMLDELERPQHIRERFTVAY